MESIVDLGRSPANRNLQPVWPLPSIDGRIPSVIPRPSKFPGVDLAYAHDAGDSRSTSPVDATGRPSHFVPNAVPALAVADGVVAYAARQCHGYALVLDHGNGWATYYANLDSVFANLTQCGRARRQRVKSGDALGYVGSAVPGDAKCLHFELWKRNDEQHFEPAESLVHMRSWTVLQLKDEQLAPNGTAAKRAA